MVSRQEENWEKIILARKLATLTNSGFRLYFSKTHFFASTTAYGEHFGHEELHYDDPENSFRKTMDNAFHSIIQLGRTPFTEL